EAAAEDLRLFAEALGSLITAGTGTNEYAPAAFGAGSGETVSLPEVNPAFGPGLSDRQKVEIFKGLLTSRLAFPEEERGSIKDVLRLESGEKVFLSGSADGSGRLEIYKLMKSDAEALDELKSRGDYVQERPAETGGTVRLAANIGPKDVPAEYFYRDGPYEEILARGASLFSAVDGFPDLNPEEQASGKDLASGIPAAPAIPPVDKASFTIVYLPRSLTDSRPPRMGEAAALPASNDEMARVLDGLMAFPEEEQFARFEKDYLVKYDLDDEDLARLTREFLYANINGAFFVVDDLSSAFDSLEEFFYKKPVFEKLDTWRRKAPRSKTAAELLFCLASAYDFEKRVIRYLAVAHPEAKDVLDRKLKPRSLFNPGVKAFVVITVCRDLLGRLARGGYSSLDEAISRYTQEQFRIYDSLLGFGGETKNRALLAAGCLLWQEGDHDGAIKRWRQIDVTSKIVLARRIQRSLEDPWGFRRSPIRLIDEDLAQDSAKNTAILHERAVKFHKWSRRNRPATPRTENP
ncbi:MAG: hypothetical protein OEW18_12565, partial [Candidatus Aminicenantes bacterium]|nr:hypothetical protein [Candidatus Aminicenantes bacterium]